MKLKQTLYTAKFIVLCLAFVGSACASAQPVATPSTAEVTLPSTTAAEESGQPERATTQISLTPAANIAKLLVSSRGLLTGDTFVIHLQGDYQS